MKTKTTGRKIRIHKWEIRTALFIVEGRRKEGSKKNGRIDEECRYEHVVEGEEKMRNMRNWREKGVQYLLGWLRRGT